MTKVKENSNSRTSRQNKTSNRYNRGQLYINTEKAQKTCLFTVDTFVLNCRHGQNKGLLKDFDFDDVLEEYKSSYTTMTKDTKTGNGTKLYKYGFDVAFNGQSIGLLLIAPRQSYKDEYDCSFKVYNHILYQNSWTLILEALLDDLGLKINNVTNLDIACDSIGFIEQYKNLNTGYYQNVGRTSHMNVQTSKNVITGFYIGSRKSNKHICGYLKGKRLEADNKSYISDYWTKNGLNIDHSKVERLELRLKNKAVKSIVNFDLMKLNDGNYLAGIYRSQIENYYQFVLSSDIDKDTNITRAKRIDIMDWDSLRFDKIDKMKKVQRPSSEWAAKRYITFGLQRLHAGYYNSKNLFENEEYQKLLVIAKDYKIEHWFLELNKRISKRDKAQIAEMKYNRMEIEAGNNSIYTTKHYDR